MGSCCDPVAWISMTDWQTKTMLPPSVECHESTIDISPINHSEIGLLNQLRQLWDTNLWDWQTFRALTLPLQLCQSALTVAEAIPPFPTQNSQSAKARISRSTHSKSIYILHSVLWLRDGLSTDWGMSWGLCAILAEVHKITWVPSWNLKLHRLPYQVSSLPNSSRHLKTHPNCFKSTPICHDENTLPKPWYLWLVNLII